MFQKYGYATRVSGLKVPRNMADPFSMKLSSQSVALTVAMYANYQLLMFFCISMIRAGVGNLRAACGSREIFVRPARPSEEKKYMDEYHVYVCY